MNLLGFEHTKIVLKSDQEPAVQDLVREIARMRSPAETLREESLVGSSASNEVVESGVQTVQGPVRVLKDVFEMGISTELDGSHNIISCIIEHASVLVNRHEVGTMGRFHMRDHWERSVGIRVRWDLPESLPSWTSDAVTKCFLGYRSNSGGMIVGIVEGVSLICSVQRKPE